jgi:UDP-glucose 4-epimerase
MKVLVTGAAGYIGSICAEVLIKRGHSVIALDNLAEGHRPAVPPEAVFRKCDLADRAGIDRVFRTYRIDAVMHFAALCIVERSVKEPGIFYSVNVAGGINLLDAMVRHGVSKFIFSSTAAVYGEPETAPIIEEQRTSPINPYGRSKLLFERVLEEFQAMTSLRYVSLRYFNAAGASVDRGEDHHPETHIIPLLLEVALGKQAHFQVNGEDYPTPDGTCVRDYVHVLDIAEAHILALDQLDRVSGQAFNVGNNRGYSVREVLESARQITGKPIPATVGPRRAGDPAVLVASSEKIRRELGWQPHLSDLKSIVEMAWAWKLRFPSGYRGTTQSFNRAK